MNPAATLSILVKAQGVQSTAGQLKGLDAAGRNAGKGMGVAEKSAKRSSKTFSVMGSAAKSAGLLVGAAGLGAGLKVAVSEFREAQKAGAQTTAVLKSTGNAAKVSKKQVEDLAGAISKKSGIDDEAIQSGENLLLTFTKLRNEQGKGNQIFDRATQIITDMSVSLNQGLKPSAIQVGKALNDPIKGITALRRVGVSFTAEQEKQIKSMVTSGNLLGAQRRILSELTKEFGGSAAAQATAGDHLKVSLNNLAEVVGSQLVPQLDKASVALTNLINDFVEGKGIATTVIPAVVGVRNAVASAIPPIVALGAAVRNVAHTLGPVFSVVAAGWRTALGGFTQWLRGWVELFTAILTGDFRKAWQSLKAIVSGAIQGIIGVVQAQTAGIRAIAGVMGKALTAGFKGALNLPHELAEAMRDLISKAPGFAFGVGKAIVRGIINGITSAASGIGSAIGGAIKKVDPTGLAKGIGDGIGKSIGAGSIVPVKGGGSLMGARPVMSKFAAVGAAKGLHVTDGKRAPGTRTSSRGVSYHSTGEAIDLGNGAGPDAAKMNVFKTLRSKFGSRLAELIYTPAGAGIKDGKPYVYTGKVAADHFDHIHVAFDSGMPGLGDGIGRMGRKPFTGDGPGSNPNAKRIWQFLISKGLTPAQAAGVLGNLSQESGFNPGAIQKGGPGRGLAQWGGDRFTALQMFAKKRGKPWTDLNTQLQFMWSELQGPEAAAGKALRSVHTVAEATSVFGSQYERFGVAGDRSGPAQAAFAAFKGVAGSANKAARSTAAGKVNPLDQSIASADVAIADAGHAIGKFSAGVRTAAALRVKQKILGSRIRTIRAALKHHQSPAKRLALTQELAQLLPQHAQLGLDRQAALAGPAAVDAGVGGGGFGGDEGDPNQALIDALNAAAEVERERIAAVAAHTEAVTTLNAEVKRQTDFATQVVATENYQLAKGLADILSGQIVGIGVAGRTLVPGAGALARY